MFVLLNGVVYFFFYWCSLLCLDYFKFDFILSYIQKINVKLKRSCK